MASIGTKMGKYLIVLVINYFVDMERNGFERNGTYSVFYRNKTERIQNGMERNGTEHVIFL